MKNVVNYLDDLKEKTGSDYASAKALNTNQSTISMIRKHARIADETAIKIADLLGINRTEVLMAAAIARSEGEVKKAWLAASKAAGIAATLVLTVSMATNLVETGVNKTVDNMHYANQW